MIKSNGVGIETSNTCNKVMATLQAINKLKTSNAILSLLLLYE